MQPQTIPLAPHSPGNPRNDTATVLELTPGHLLCAYHAYVPSPQAGHDYGRANGVLRESIDSGRTWSEPRVVVEPAPEDQNVHGQALGRAANGGRLILPFHGGDGEQGTQHNAVGLAWSDDNGRSWTVRHPLVDLPLRGAMEASVAECADGSLLMSLRSQLGSVMLCRSTDQGESWSRPQTCGLRSPESCTCLRRLPDSEALLLIWNDAEYDPRHHHFGERSPLSLAVSPDQGRTWRRAGHAAAEPEAGYTNQNCTFLAEGTAYLTYMYCRPAFNREWLDLWALKIGLAEILTRAL